MLVVMAALFVLPSFASAATYTRTLTLGSTGADVSSLQTFLKEKGFYTFPTITGYFGPVTKDALAKYQASVGLEAVGQVGPKTLALLNGAAPVSSSPLTALILQLQGILRLAGFTNITATGILDSATVSAAQYFAANGDSAPHSSGGGGHHSSSNNSDTTAPAITLTGTTPAQTSATVAWTTDEAADSQAEYGTTSSYTASTTLDSSLVTSHSVSVTGLTASTTYHYRVLSTDASGNLAASTDQTFTTTAAADTTAPTITAIASSTSTTGATITWTTNENADSRVDYGSNSSYGTASTSATLGTSHSITLSGLTSSTVYHFRIQSTDASSNVATSSDLTFTTSTGADTTGPVISSVASSSVSALSATITWSTNENSDSTVQFGTTTAYGTASTSAALSTSHSIVLTGLTGNTVYHFSVSSTDASSNVSSTTDYSFTTLPEYVTVLLAGQSNMVGTQNGATFDYAGLDATSTRIFQWSFDGQGSTTLAKTIITASDPLLHPGSAASTRGIGPGMPFARALLPTLASDQKVLLVPTAVGGTGLVGDTWSSPSGTNYVNAKNALTNVLASTTSARADYILWWQGENDMFYNRSDSAYKTAVDAVFAGFRSVPKAENAKILIGGVVQEYFSGDATKTAIQLALADTPLRVANSYFLPPGIGSYTSGDTWHAKAGNQRVIGTTWANAASLPAYYTTNVPATPTATIKGEVVDVTLNGAPQYIIQSRALNSSDAWTQTVMYPEATSTHQYIVLPGTGSREAQVVARSYAGSSTPSTLMTFDASTTAAVSVPTPLWDHDYDNSPVDGSNVYTSITSVGTDTSSWTNVGSTTRTTVNGKGALNITASTQAVYHTGTIPTGSYTIFGAFYNDYGTAGTQIYGDGVLSSGHFGPSLSRGLLVSANIGSFAANHNNSSSPVRTNPFDLRRQGYVTVAAVFDSTTNNMKIYVNGQLFKSGTIAARSQDALSTKAWNQLSDGRTDAFSGAKLAWKVWSSALTQDQIIKVQNDVKDAYGVTFAN